MAEILTEFTKTTESDNRKIRFGYYLVIVLLHWYMMRWLQAIIKMPFSQEISYLTHISFYINFVYYIYVLLLHTSLNNKIKHANFLRGLFKFGYSLSFSVFVLYWALILVDPKLLS